ncbi:hypothetical protein F5141DRAFT_1218859 [Pisolithus sp. B1]|nr:hypothetical protein F5141DRAFT_1218859 [Pisolithus sp. B1]
MIVPEQPITFFAELPPCPGVILERDVSILVGRPHLPPTIPGSSAAFQTAPQPTNYITSAARRRLGKPNRSVDKHPTIRMMHAEPQNQLPAIPQRQSGRLDPAETRSATSKRFQGVCHLSNTHPPVVATERITPTVLSHDVPISSNDKLAKSMAVDDSNVAVPPSCSRSSQPINHVSSPTLPADMGHVQSPEREGRLTRVDPSAMGTMCSPTVTLLPAPTHPAQQPRPPAAVPSSSPRKPASSLLSSDETRTRSANIAAVNPITPQLLLNHPDSRTLTPDTTTTAAVAPHTAQPSWPLKRMEKAIRKQREYVTFYRSFSGGPLDSPPDVPQAYEHPWRISDLYVHHNQTENTFQVWMRSETGWIKAAVDTHHPTLSNYRLKLLDNGEPSWVLRKTMVTDRRRAQRKQEA